MKTNSKPVISFLIPTYNSQKYLRRCLKSIEKQTVQKNNYQVLIIDGGSTDNTIQIVNDFKKILPIKIYLNLRVDAESGKRIGIKNSSSDFIVLLDSDNEIVNKNWLSTAIRIFHNHPEIWGIESPWFVNPKDKLINQYFSMMKMTDPIARLFNPIKEEVHNFDNYQIIKVNSTDTPVIGANGFFWRREVVNARINRTNKFEETNYVSFLISSGRLRYARLNKYGIYHYYCYSIFNYIQKRKKIANKFIERKRKKQKTWVDKVGPTKFLLSVLYNASIILPSLEAVIQIFKTKNIAWVYHPVISFLTVVIYSYYYVKRLIINL